MTRIALPRTETGSCCSWRAEAQFPVHRSHVFRIHVALRSATGHAPYAAHLYAVVEIVRSRAAMLEPDVWHYQRGSVAQLLFRVVLPLQGSSR